MFNYHPKLVSYMVNETNKTVVGLIILSIMYLIAFHTIIPTKVLIVWSVLQTIFILFRYLNARVLQRYLDEGNVEKINLHVRYFFLMILYSSAVWNFAFMAVVYYGEKSHEYIALALAMGIITAGTVSLASLFLVFVVYFILMLLPISIVFYIIGEHGHMVVLMFISIFIPSIITVARAIHNYILKNAHIMDLLEDKVEDLEKLSSMDPLTNVHNRRYFFDVANQLFEVALRDKNKNTLLVIDIDYFKVINDNYGHPVGDAVLVEIAQHIDAMRRSSDVFARIGGEEFGLLLVNTSKEQALEIAEKIRASIEQKEFIYEHKKVDVTISIGVESIKTGISSFSALYHKTDIHLYDAKRSGRNRVMA